MKAPGPGINRTFSKGRLDLAGGGQFVRGTSALAPRSGSKQSPDRRKPSILDNTASFTLAGDAPPQGRYEHACAVVASSECKAMIIHGGRTHALAKPVDSMYMMEMQARSLEWKKMRPANSAQVGSVGGSDMHGQMIHAQTRRKRFIRRAHTMTTLPGGTSKETLLFMFGGRMESGEDGRVCAEPMIIQIDALAAGYKLKAMTFYGQIPQARAFHTALVLAQFLVIFGGINKKDAPLNDVHLLHLSSWCWVKVLCPTAGVPNATPWPCPRWAHAAVPLTRGTCRGGVAMMIFGGIKADGNMLDDAHMLTFNVPVDFAGRGASAGAEALDAYPTGIVVSLYDRLQKNVDLVVEMQTRTQQRVQDETQDYYTKLNEAEMRCSQDEVAARREEDALARVKQMTEEARDKLDKVRVEVAELEEEARNDIQKAESKAEFLRRRLKRLQLTSEILDRGRISSMTDVSCHPSDRGASVVYLRPDVPVSKASLVDAYGLPKDDALPSTQNQAGDKRYVDSLHVGAASDHDVSYRRVGIWRSAQATLEYVQVEHTETQQFEGGSSRVSQGQVSFSEKKAVLMEPPSSKVGQRWLEAAKQELRHTGVLRHPNLLEFYGVAFGGEQMCFISEPPLVPLEVELYARQPPWLAHARARQDLIYNVALAVEYIHCLGVVHRCVTLPHIFLQDDIAGAHPMAKLGGLLPARVFFRSKREKLKAQEQHSHGHVPATPQASPARQLLHNRLHNEPSPYACDPRAADVYSLGALTVKLLATEAEDDEPSLGLQVSAAVRSVAVSRIADKTLRLVVLKCMEREPQYRMSASMVARALHSLSKGNSVGCLEPILDDLSRNTPLVDADLVRRPKSSRDPDHFRSSDKIKSR